MTDISVSGLVKSFEIGNNILDGLSFDITAGEHIGILGHNGCGKTTLFRILVGETDYDEGTVSIASGRRMGLISQIPVYPDGYTAEDVLREAHRPLYKLQSRMEALAAKMAEDASPALLSEYDRLADEFRRRGGYDMDVERNRVANGLEISETMREQLFESLSGGEKTRLNLARLILEDTDILLLDEPTNHLDLRATQWLEDYIAHFRGTVLAISHDRYFLDVVCRRCIEINEGKAEFYSGNYSFYVIERQRRFEEKLKKYEKDQAKVEQLTRAAEQMHLWAFMGNDKLHKRAFSMEKRIEKLQTTPKPVREKKLSVKFKQREFSGDEVLVIDGLSKAYGEKQLFKNLTATVAGRERIALIGDNGTGKSSLIKIIMNGESPDAGCLRQGPSVKAAYLPQIVEFSEASRSCLDTMLYDCKCSPQDARDRLAAFGFRGEDVLTPVAALSGGERSRLKLCMIMGADINLLILDEPTNHLDIASREWMEDALGDYEEALIFVSHDRYFIEKFATRIWLLENGEFTDFRGSYAEFTDYRARRETLTRIEKTARRKAEPRRREGGSTQKKLERTEREIEKAEAALKDLEAEAEEFATDYERLMEIDEKKAAVTAELDALYEQWGELSE